VRLATYLAGARPTLGVEVEGGWAAAGDLLAGAPASMADLIAAGPDGLERLRAAVADRTVTVTGGPPRLLAPVQPGKIVAIGRNYREHAAEEGVDPPAAPLIFAKLPSSVVGPGDEIRWDPGLTAQVDYEAELGVVIGRRARRVALEAALDHVFGYTCLNDVSARDLQFGDGQWIRGKSLDTFCPIGPVIVTADEIPDPQALAIRATVNGEVLQDASTAQMYFGVAELISYCSLAFTLEPGDVIATGTPSGVGVFRKPPRFLGDGDRVVVEIERIGRLENACRFDPAEAAA
jgi:2-keto-4-pentenoate hydratase/2-oxohepta-3-ene-1,7-dioic acid hydratase in catechol pathway